MKLTFVLAAAAILLSDTALAFRLPALLYPRQAQQPKCSLYSGFKDLPSFSSFCKQLPRPTMPAAATNVPIATSSSSKKAPSVSMQRFTFDGGQASTISPVNPVISSAAAGSTFEMQNYTITTTGKPAPSDVEVNCYINGSKVPMSECIRTAGLTRQHGYTYSIRTTASSKPASSRAVKTSSHKPAPTSSFISSGQFTSSSQPAESSSKAASSSSKSASSASAPRASSSTTSAPLSGASAFTSSTLTSTNCTRTRNLTRLHGYTYSDGTAPQASTPKLTSSSVSINSLKPVSSEAASTSLKSSSTKVSGTGSTLSTSSVNSYNCDNITAAEPHRMGSTTSKSISSSEAQTPSSSESTSTSSNSSATSSTAEATESQSQRATSRVPIRPFVKMQQTSTTTVVDATVTTVVPCATEIGKPAEQKRDALDFMATTAGGICDAGVYCINSTFVSDAPPSWHWDAVALKKEQTCLEDNVFNTEWVELQCACAGL